MTKNFINRSNNMINLTDCQKIAIKKAITWYFDQNKKPYFILAGLAGTGKSTVASTAVKMMGLSNYQVLYVTPTGKAASVLRSKGCVANTIHSMFYRVVQGENGKIFFSRKPTIPNTIKLIVIDEVSMVNKKIMEDIMKYGIPMLCLGDPGQLPAMFYPNTYLYDEQDVFLNQIMRQQGESSILKLANMARIGEEIPFGKYGSDGNVIHMKDIHDYEKYDVVLTWTNSTRKEINKLIRNKLGYNSVYPIAGEKIICLKNSYMYEMDCGDEMILSPVNGMGLTALSDHRESTNGQKNDYFMLKFSPDFIKDRHWECPISRIPFEAYLDMRDYEDEIINIPQFQVVLDFGYAVTVNKSQGSEYGDVLLIDEFRGSDKDYAKFLYTGITRAKKSITIARF